MNQAPTINIRFHFIQKVDLINQVATEESNKYNYLEG